MTKWRKRGRATDNTIGRADERATDNQSAQGWPLCERSSLPVGELSPLRADSPTARGGGGMGGIGRWLCPSDAPL